MVFTAITYGSVTLAPHTTRWGTLHGLTIETAIASGAGAEVVAYLPYTVAVSQQVGGYLRDKPFRVKSLIISPSVLAAPISMYAILWTGSVGKISGISERITVVDGDVVDLPISDCERVVNWDGFNGTTNWFMVLYFSALTIGDTIGVNMELEVEDL